jgi:hypothetical protein
MKTNCWEFNECGRQPGGFNVQDLGVCSTAQAIWCDEVQKTIDSGKYCWSINTGEKLCDSCDVCEYYIKEKTEVFE